MRPRCAIDQNAFPFPGARPNMADAWNKNSDWEDDNDINNDLAKFVSLNLKRMEILHFLTKDYPMYAWSLRVWHAECSSLEFNLLTMMSR